MYYQQTEPAHIEETAKKVLLAQQQQLFSQITNFYKINRKNYTTKELKEKILFFIKYARYNSNGYFWVNDMDYRMIMHPIKPEYDGMMFSNIPKVPFVALGVDTLKKSKNSEAFIKYKFYNPTTKKYELKVSLVKVFKPFNWVIGTGQYLSDITPIVQENALKNIRALRYAENGYFWINDTNNKMLMHPIKPEYDGKVFIDTPKVPFVALGVEALKKSKTDRAIIEYSFYNPATKMYERKLSIVKLFKPWNWIIGTGVYLDAIDNSIAEVKAIKDREKTSFLKSIILVSFLMIIVIILFAYYLVSKFIITPMNTLHNEKEYFEEISQIDYLTNILNRRAFFNEVNKYFAYAKRNNISLSVMMIDIDFFKNINDSYGHEAGDFVLKELSKLIANNIREEDIFGRLGGEEFGLCILNDTDETLCVISQKIRKAVENNIVHYKGFKITFTISIGGYKLTSSVENFEIALNKADQALYNAKTDGRNKVKIYNKILCN
jgi:methyl-accepting chemotaxis protein